MTTKYLVDTNSVTGYAQVLQEVQGGNVSRKYTYGLSLISENQTIAGTATVSFYGFDGHGSVRQITDRNGAVTDTYTYDAFGNLLTTTGSTPNNFKFAGEQFDPHLGLYYNRARYLDVRSGRFWGMDSKDGIDTEPLSLHRYAYVRDNPVNHIDKSGFEDADLASVTGTQSIANSLSALASNVGVTTLTAIRGVLTISAAIASKIFASPNAIEEIQEGGEEAVAKVQQSYLEFDGVITEGESELTSIWNNYQSFRLALNQLYTRSPLNPSGIQYHHIVEQTEEELSGFTPRAINSMSNIIPTPQTVHQAITDFYNTGQAWLTEGQTLLQYMASQTWEYQWRAGLEIWKQAMVSGGQLITWRPQ